MFENWFPLVYVLPASVLAVVMVVAAARLKRGDARAYQLGLRGRWRTHDLGVALQAPELDLNDHLDREHSFEMNKDEKVSYLSTDGHRDLLGLIPPHVRIGFRNQVDVGPMKIAGVPVTGLIEVVRSDATTTFRWRPVFRYGPWILTLVFMSTVEFVFTGNPEPAHVFCGVVLAGALLLNLIALRSVSKMAESVREQLVEAHTRDADSPGVAPTNLPAG